MTIRNTVSFASLAALAAGCTAMPTYEAIKHGWSREQVEVTEEVPSQSDYNDYASGWARPTTGASHASSGTGRSSAQMVSWNGSPVSADPPGRVTTTDEPLNDGVANPAGGSRSNLLDLYTEAVEAREELTARNEDLSLALEMAETRAADLADQLTQLQIDFDELGKQKQAATQDNFDLAARLATAQVARLEAERALLEATLEWRKMAAENNAPLSSRPMGDERP